MPLISGRYAKVTLGTTPIEYTGHWEIRLEHDDMDASYFGSVWKENEVGMQGWSGSLEGYFNGSTVAAGSVQHLVFKNIIEGTLIQDIRFYTATATSLFFMPQFTTMSHGSDTDAGAYLTNLRVTADKAAVTTVGFDIRGYGPLGLFNSTAAGGIIVHTTT